MLVITNLTTKETLWEGEHYEVQNLATIDPLWYLLAVHMLKIKNRKTVDNLEVTEKKSKNMIINESWSSNDGTYEVDRWKRK